MTKIMYRAIPNSSTMHPSIVETREQAERYLAGAVDGGSISEVTVNFGAFNRKIYHGHIHGGTSYYASASGDVRSLSLDGSLREVEDIAVQPRPPKAFVKKAIQSGRRQSYGSTWRNAAGKDRAFVEVA